MKNIRLLPYFFLAMVCFFSPDAGLSRNSLPAEGGTMPEIVYPPPFDKAAREALGLLPEAENFRISDFRTDLILMEVIGVYCPVCFKQAPGFNDLYSRLNRGRLKGRVTMFALAAGGSDNEILPLAESGQYTFPIVSDLGFQAHKLLGEPKTPFVIVCRPDGTILYTHLGLISDIDEFYTRIKSFLKKK